MAFRRETIIGINHPYFLAFDDDDEVSHWCGSIGHCQGGILTTVTDIVGFAELLSLGTLFLL
ncbi:hypothetical protein [Moritella sp. Urea-trap-13]|uniref:hypothetical protein n=1 Tax=Moritella sp. Urea-trap-13 TaxID=2058327 RepID=UPI000C339A73|nr:hypothetical protein [Moritella sp. Urea-trap-13]PKH07834.1 hypothetical protein CXF93_03840 [Moritella sp. Urea-trap-13]